jgi:3-oxoadipate enol-lactonase
MDFRWPPPPEGRREAVAPVPRAPRSSRPVLPSAPTELVSTPHGIRLECLRTGVGDPVTVFAHGLGGGIAETRPLGSGVDGRRVFFQFRGHGRSDAPPGRWTYADLARDLRAVADLCGATRAVGVSLGAGALCRLVAESPQRFGRLVFFLPAALDTPRQPAARERFELLLAAVREGDAARVAEVISLEVPAHLRNTPSTWAFLRQRLDQLMRDGLAEGLAALPEQAPVADRGPLSTVVSPALVIGVRGDDVHPASVAEQLAAALPNATLHVYDKPGVLWTQRTDLRQRIAGFLNH